jgi:hypothetical protein
MCSGTSARKTEAAMNPEDIQEARMWSEYYKMRGFQPLPSSPEKKKPLCRFADYWESPAPIELFDKFPTSNIQVVCGRPHRLLVIDLDGPEAEQRFNKMGRVPPTWTVCSGGGGKLLWFKLPPNYPKPLPKGFIWESQARLDALEFNRTVDHDKRIELPHEAIERLCDRSLVMAPPSIHPKTGKRYAWRNLRLSPKKMPIPAMAPQWVLDLELAKKKTVEQEMPLTSIPIPVVSSHGKRDFSSEEVLAAIQDKVGLARKWGLRITGTPSERGWVPCRAIDRPDNNPSAAIHDKTGIYVDKGSGTKLNYLNLAVAMGAYRSWHEALTDLGNRYGACS